MQVKIEDEAEHGGSGVAAGGLKDAAPDLMPTRVKEEVIHFFKLVLLSVGYYYWTIISKEV
jgi:hypothetical protein